MDYPQFLMACVDEYINDVMAYRNKNDIGYDDLCDWWSAENDSMIIDIECINYVNHDDELCPSYLHLGGVDDGSGDSVR